MSPAPLKLVPPSANARVNMAAPPRQRGAPTAARIARRRWRVMVAKRVLPLVALALLTSIAVWPELGRDSTGIKLFTGNGGVEPESGQLTQARYNGVNDHGEPFTVTAQAAHQVNADRIDLIAPVGDMTLQGGTWMRGEGRDGVYMQHDGQLDLSGDVTLYRDDGVTLQTDAATMDIKAGAASSAALVHVEGPFGTLDAQGFVVLDHGRIVQFTGPGRLLLNGASK